MRRVADCFPRRETRETDDAGEDRGDADGRAGSTAGRSPGRWGIRSAPAAALLVSRGVVSRRRVAVHLTYGAESGYALIDRALYLVIVMRASRARRTRRRFPGRSSGRRVH